LKYAHRPGSKNKASLSTKNTAESKENVFLHLNLGLEHGQMREKDVDLGPKKKTNTELCKTAEMLENDLQTLG